VFIPLHSRLRSPNLISFLRSPVAVPSPHGSTASRTFPLSCLHPISTSSYPFSFLNKLTQCFLIGHAKEKRQLHSFIQEYLKARPHDPEFCLSRCTGRTQAACVSFSSSWEWRGCGGLLFACHALCESYPGTHRFVYALVFALPFCLHKPEPEHLPSLSRSSLFLNQTYPLAVGCICMFIDRKSTIFEWEMRFKHARMM
jgi:hypothetical protein